mmetsp:Transcript_18223/g.40252  ORF Transcript_18223/g.40252 Transcript_18223/m.40252 type:complete len:200 (+) Transcript_18223:364-963(+)
MRSSRRPSTRPTPRWSRPWRQSPSCRARGSRACCTGRTPIQWITTRSWDGCGTLTISTSVRGSILRGSSAQPALASLWLNGFWKATPGPSQRISRPVTSSDSTPSWPATGTGWRRGLVRGTGRHMGCTGPRSSSRVGVGPTGRGRSRRSCSGVERCWGTASAGSGPCTFSPPRRWRRRPLPTHPTWITPCRPRPGTRMT